MDEKQFFEHIDKKFEAVGLLIGDLIDKVDDTLKWVEARSVVEKTLLDVSKEPKAKSRYAKQMPLQVGDWIIADKGCNRCGGRIAQLTNQNKKNKN